MVAAVLALLTSTKHVQPDEQLLHLGLQDPGTYQVRIFLIHDYLKMMLCV